MKALLKRIPQSVLVVAAVVAVGLFLRVAFGRAAYPFELEWMEGGVLEHALRIREGKALYTEPSLEWTPFIYNPLYYYLGAVFTFFFGQDLLALRLLSILATCASFALHYVLASRVFGGRVAGILALGLFAATFRLSGAWFDLARIDAVAHALSLGALLALTPKRAEDLSPRRLVVSGVLLAFAFFTKQSALLVMPALLLGVFVARGLRGAAYFCGAAALVAAVGLAYLHASSGGWYWYYALELPLSHSGKGREYLRTQFFQLEMFGPQPFLSLLAFLGASPLFSPRGLDPRKVTLLCSALAWIVSSYFTRLHMGSSLNDLIPLHSAFALLGASGYALLRSQAPGPLTWAASLALVVQFVLLVYPVAPNLPRRADRVAGEEVVKRIAELDGSVLVFHHPHLARRAGKPGHSHAMALIDIEVSDGDPRGIRELFRKNVKESLASGQFDHIVLDDFEMIFGREIRAAYKQSGKFPWKDRTFQPLIATQSRPEKIFTFRGRGAPKRPGPERSAEQAEPSRRAVEQAAPN